ncbi:MAG: PilZ domain-containing protein [Acidobacteria bacterium]|nr:PilZ domain-containing protein [Acidobacteriota bacterium]
MITLSKTRQTTRNLLRFFVKLRPLDKDKQEDRQAKAIDALIADTSEGGVGVFTESLLPVGTIVEVIINETDSVIGRVVNRDYLFPDNDDIIRLGIHFDKPFNHWPIEISKN